MSDRIDPRTCRPAGDAVSEAHRAEDQHWARRTLNRVRPTEVAALLADILGLNEGTPRHPGYCPCGAELPISAKSAWNPDQYRQGRCGKCTAATPPRMPPAREQAYERPEQPYAGGTATCPYCNRTYQLRGDGRLRIHPAWGRRAQANVRLRVDCPGSRRYPNDPLATT